MKAKKLIAGLAIASLLLLGGSAFAEPDAIDAVPAATLLLPYFEVDLANAGGTTTLFSINNASAAPTVAHVTVWSNLTVPVLDWNVFLTGYDVHSINLRDVLNGDLIPRTAHQTNDPGDTISPHGITTNNPAWDSGASFPGCNDKLPLAGIGTLNATFVAYVQNALTGVGATVPGQAGSFCYAAASGASHAAPPAGTAVGYITVDNSNDCSLFFPDNDVDYWAADFPSEVNQLWGDWAIVDPANNFASGDNLVSIEADPSYQGMGYTFYGRYIGWDGDDQREPLGNAWGTRYLNGGNFTGGTDLIVWRDSKEVISRFVCGGLPFPFPLNETQVVAFDEQESAEELCFDPGGGNVSPPLGDDDPACFPYETQRVSANAAPLQPSWPFGWLYLNLDHTVTGGSAPPFAAAAAQSHVTTLHSALGLYQVGYQATLLHHVRDTPPEAPLIVGDID